MHSSFKFSGASSNIPYSDVLPSSVGEALSSASLTGTVSYIAVVVMMF